MITAEPGRVLPTTLTTSTAPCAGFARNGGWYLYVAHGKPSAAAAAGCVPPTVTRNHLTKRLASLRGVAAGGADVPAHR